LKLALEDPHPTLCGIPDREGTQMIYGREAYLLYAAPLARLDGAEEVQL
jgi:hypothetical protein